MRGRWNAAYPYPIRAKKRYSDNPCCTHPGRTGRRTGVRCPSGLCPGIQGRESLREFPAGELGNRFGDVRVILHELSLHVTHAQEALELRLLTRAKRLRQGLDVLLVNQKLT